jgi:PAS domain S-box-containing protein
MSLQVRHGNPAVDKYAIVAADAAGTIRLWNAGAEKFFGHSSAQAVGQPLDLIIPEDYRGAHSQCFAAAMSTATAKLEGHPFDLPVKVRGQVVAVRGILSLVRDPDKNVVGAMAVLTLPD